MRLVKLISEFLKQPNEGNWEINRIDFYIAIFCGIFAVLVFTPFMFIGVDVIHHGILLVPAVAINKGAVIFRDVFTQYGPLTTYIHVLSFKLFGQSVFATHLITLIFYFGTTIVFYLFARFFLSKIETITIVMAWIFSSYFFAWTPFPWSSAYSLFFSLLASLFALYGLRRNTKLFVLSGLFVALTFWSRQSVGVPYFVSLSIMFALYVLFGKKQKRKYYLLGFLYFLLGVFIPTGMYILYLHREKALVDMYLNMFVFAYYWGNKYGYSYNLWTLLDNLYPVSFVFITRAILLLFPSLSLAILGLNKNSKNRRIIYALLYLSVLVAIVFVPFFPKYINIIVADPTLLLSLALVNTFGIFVFIYLFFKDRNELFGDKNYLLLLLFFSSLASWAQYFPINDQVHGFYAMPLMIILLAVGVRSVIKKLFLVFQNNKNPSAIDIHILFILVIAVLWLGGGIPRMINGFKKLSNYQNLRLIRRPPILWGIIETNTKAKTAENLYDVLVKARKVNKNKNIVVLGNMPLALVFFPDNKLTKHYSDWGIYHDKTYPGYRDEKLNRIALEKPIVIVTGYHFGDRKKYARLLDYKIIYEDNLHDNEHAVLIPR